MDMALPSLIALRFVDMASMITGFAPFTIPDAKVDLLALSFAVALQDRHSPSRIGFTSNSC